MIIEKKWAGSNKVLDSPNVTAQIQLFNRMAGWTSATILSYDNLKHRVAAMTKMIAILWSLKSFNDFGGMMCILCGLRSATVYRLHKTKEKLDATSKQHLETVNQLLSRERGYITFRRALSDAKNSNLPYLPYIGKELTDLTFIDEGNPNLVDEVLINICKWRMTGEIIQDLLSFRNRQYKFVVDPTIRNYLLNYTCVLSEDELYEKSKTLEPKKN